MNPEDKLGMLEPTSILAQTLGLSRAKREPIDEKGLGLPLQYNCDTASVYQYSVDLVTEVREPKVRVGLGLLRLSSFPL